MTCFKLCCATGDFVVLKVSVAILRSPVRKRSVPASLHLLERLKVWQQGFDSLGRHATVAVGRSRQCSNSV